MKKVAILTILLAILAFSSGFAQMAEEAALNTIKKDHLGLEPASKPFSLIDLSKLHWGHSYSFNYFSGGGTSGSVGVYTGNLLYEFSGSLSLGLQLGIAHNPGALFDKMQQTNAVFLPGATLDFHPSENFRITAGFNTYYGNYYYPFGSYYYPWRY